MFDRSDTKVLARSKPLLTSVGSRLAPVLQRLCPIIGRKQLSKILRGIVAGYGAKKLGGGCFTTILIFLLLWWLLGGIDVFG